MNFSGNIESLTEPSLREFEAAANNYPNASRLVLSQNEGGCFSVEPHQPSIRGKLIKFLTQQESKKNKEIVESFKRAITRETIFSYNAYGSLKARAFKTYLDQCVKKGLSAHDIREVLRHRKKEPFAIGIEIKPNIATPLNQEQRPQIAVPLNEDQNTAAAILEMGPNTIAHYQNFIRNAFSIERSRQLPNVRQAEPKRSQHDPIVEEFSPNGERLSPIEANPWPFDQEIRLHEGRPYVITPTLTAEDHQQPIPSATARPLSKAESDRIMASQNLEVNHPKLLTQEEANQIRNDIINAANTRARIEAARREQQPSLPMEPPIDEVVEQQQPSVPMEARNEEVLQESNSSRQTNSSPSWYSSFLTRISIFGQTNSSNESISRGINQENRERKSLWIGFIRSIHSFFGF